MLVLTRKISEAIVAGNISDDDGVPQMVKITVLEISGGSVRLGIEVPLSVAVHRLEVWNRISHGNFPAKVS